MIELIGALATCFLAHETELGTFVGAEHKGAHGRTPRVRTFDFRIAQSARGRTSVLRSRVTHTLAAVSVLEPLAERGTAIVTFVHVTRIQNY